MKVLKPNSLDPSRVLQFCDKCRMTFDVKKDKLFKECPKCNGDIERAYGKTDDDLNNDFISDPKNNIKDEFKERYKQAKSSIRRSIKKLNKNGTKKSCCGQNK